MTLKRLGGSMDDLADKIIKATEQEIIEKQSGDQAPEGYYTDDLGYWVELDIRKHKEKFARYVFVRCRKRNPHLYYDTDEMKLYNRHEVIEPKVADIIKLANLADMITAAQAIWVYNRLKDTVPRLDKSRLVVAPGLIWDFETAELILDDNYYSVGGENDT